MKYLTDKLVFMNAVQLLIRGSMEKENDLEDVLDWLQDIVDDYQVEIKKQSK